MHNGFEILEGDALESLRTLEAESVQICVTSPPYWGLRDYGNESQIGLEPDHREYVARLVAVFAEVRRILRDDGTLWLNLGDSYAIPRNANTLKPKDLAGIPWRVALALQDDGWYLRQDIIWHKPNPMPESIRDRCTKAHEYLFLLAKSERYRFDADSIAEPAKYAGRVVKASNPETAKNGQKGEFGATSAGFTQHDTIVGDTRNRRSVWTVAAKPYRGAHFAVMPEQLVEPCILAGSSAGDLVLDPFTGSGTVGAVALRHGRRFVGCELNPEYIALAEERIGAEQTLFTNAVDAAKGDK